LETPAKAFPFAGIDDGRGGVRLEHAKAPHVQGDRTSSFRDRSPLGSIRRRMSNGRRRVCIVGAGISGLGAAWSLAKHPERFEFELYEKNDRIGGNAITVEIPQDDGTTIPVDISVTAYIPTVYHHYVTMLEKYGIASMPTRFSYSVHYGDGVYAHDFESPLKEELRPEIEKFQALLKKLKKWSVFSDSTSKLRASMNPYNYITMGRLLDKHGFSSAFRYKILKPLFVNFVLASGLFDMPAALFARYLDFFDIEKSTPMVTWDQGTANLYRRMSESFKDRIHLNRAVKSIVRDSSGVTVKDEQGREERFDDVVLACNANQGLMMLAQPSSRERYLLGSIKYESELHNHVVVHTDGSVLPNDATKCLETRSNFVLQYGSRPDNYEITYIMHNQQPWAKRSDKPCLVTYNPIQKIDESKIVKKWWVQHVVHDVFHVTVLMNAFRFIQGQEHTWHCGAHTVVNSQEHGFISGLAVAHQLGADYPFDDPKAAEWFNFWGTSMFGGAFRKV
jgi:predicted NAD/FAD-binding protein